MRPTFDVCCVAGRDEPLFCSGPSQRGLHHARKGIRVLQGSEPVSHSSVSAVTDNEPRQGGN
jgi:hypothetical protein